MVVSVEVVVSVRVSDFSGAEQEVTPSAREDTRNSVSKCTEEKWRWTYAYSMKGLYNLFFRKLIFTRSQFVK